MFEVQTTENKSPGGRPKDCYKDLDKIKFVSICTKIQMFRFHCTRKEIHWQGTMRPVIISMTVFDENWSTCYTK